MYYTIKKLKYKDKLLLFYQYILLFRYFNTKVLYFML